jgi:hypothetical protein
VALIWYPTLVDKATALGFAVIQGIPSSTATSAWACSDGTGPSPEWLGNWSIGRGSGTPHPGSRCRPHGTQPTDGLVTPAPQVHREESDPVSRSLPEHWCEAEGVKLGGGFEERLL